MSTRNGESNSDPPEEESNHPETESSELGSKRGRRKKKRGNNPTGRNQNVYSGLRTPAVSTFALMKAFTCMKASAHLESITCTLSMPSS